MTNDVLLTQKEHDQIPGLLDQLVEISTWQDAEAKAKDPLKNPGESFMTNKLKIVRDTLKNENR